jgi:transcriptional regulator with XRE-family HTH domain
MEKLLLTKEEFVKSNRYIIGGEIRKYREKKGFSQEYLATLMDISRATISKIENGKFAFSVDYLAKFAWHLDFDIAIFEKEQIKQKN